MILINQQKLEPSAKDENHPLHEYWKQVEDGKEKLRRRFPEKVIEFHRLGYPDYVDGIDGKGREVQMPKPSAPVRFPLKTNYHHPERGTELWACCLDSPKILPGNLWDLGNKNSFSVDESLRVNIESESDFAYYLCYISNAVKSGQLFIYDPKAEIKAKADAERQDLERKFTIWKQLDDEGAVRMAKWLGIPDSGNDTADGLRFKIESTLKDNDDKAKRDPSVRGTTEEFMKEMKPSDYARARVFLRDALDESSIVWKPDGTYRVGDKVLIHIAKNDLDKKFDKLCDFISAPAHAEDFRSLMRDVMSKDYLDKLKDVADYRWIAKVMDIQGYYNKPEEQVKQMVYTEFNMD